MGNRTAAGLVLLICGVGAFVYARSIAGTQLAIVLGIGGLFVGAIGLRIAFTKDPSKSKN
jgi:xanthine/uracil permease